MSAYADIDETALRHRRKSLNATARIITRAYSTIVLNLHQAGVNGPLARKTAIQQTAQAVSKLTNTTVTAAEVESALAAGGYIRG